MINVLATSGNSTPQERNHETPCTGLQAGSKEDTLHHEQNALPSQPRELIGDAMGGPLDLRNEQYKEDASTQPILNSQATGMSMQPGMMQKQQEMTIMTQHTTKQAETKAEEQK